ncbi:helix-turn-helix domain-containing protein [Glaesserella parasuis]|uniref:Helix-turn-helix transcriptional regulator n=2 Tax=Glaesserella parasuis TaxID=738 RepID=A0AAX1M5V9_GLAPU|nr:helix-turn-helix transcriptional regulator [Glaesserella parasuis]MCT8517665.1 helix-turn-helix domain-containing protein [Glaesserella parasuis]MCT8544739.1 helix-turn-helix domain-containing protein [Glaesserella parasuis]MCT8548519.1 helix-turn-helix domain-containing protein [Glaesserella parasuis]MCT8557109.1 helix-turn-helix domain-containing protein [Glaesserella parasuis]MCT8571123.1 helix-turn-helix domain-containing protein [Glaesserella parasuis]
MSINERVCLIVEHFGGSIAKFSERSGINYRSVQNYMRGEREPNSEAYLKFAQLGININWLLTGQGEMFIGGTPESPLTQKEQTLLEDYRESNEQGKAAIEEAASALAATAALTARQAA